jgi:DNA repair photolyase
MRDNGIKTVVWLCPFLPFINDTEENVLSLLDYCIEAGVYGIICFGIGLTLREGDREYYYAKLDEHFPGLKQKYQKRYGLSYELTSDNNDALMKLVYNVCNNNDIVCGTDELFKYMGTFEEKNGAQIELF